MSIPRPSLALSTRTFSHTGQTALPPPLLSAAHHTTVSRHPHLPSAHPPAPVHTFLFRAPVLSSALVHHARPVVSITSHLAVRRPSADFRFVIPAARAHALVGLSLRLFTSCHPLFPFLSAPRLRGPPRLVLVRIVAWRARALPDFRGRTRWLSRCYLRFLFLLFLIGVVGSRTHVQPTSIVRHRHRHDRHPVCRSVVASAFLFFVFVPVPALELVLFMLFVPRVVVVDVVIRLPLSD